MRPISRLPGPHLLSLIGLRPLQGRYSQPCGFPSSACGESANADATPTGPRAGGGGVWCARRGGGGGGAPPPPPLRGRVSRCRRRHRLAPRRCCAGWGREAALRGRVSGAAARVREGLGAQNAPGREERAAARFPRPPPARSRTVAGARARAPARGVSNAPERCLLSGRGSGRGVGSGSRARPGPLAGEEAGGGGASGAGGGVCARAARGEREGEGREPAPRPAPPRSPFPECRVRRWGEDGAPRGGRAPGAESEGAPGEAWTRG
jgi:hypothetical protein